MVSFSVSVTATNPLDGGYQRVWAIFVDTPPGMYRGSGTWDAGTPLYESLASSGDTWSPSLDLPPGSHDLYFVISSPDTGSGQYSGTLKVAGSPDQQFSGVSENTSAKVTVSVQGGQGQVIDGVQVQAPPGTTDVFVMQIASAGGIIPTQLYIEEALAKAVAQFQGYSVTGITTINNNSELLVFVHSPTGGSIPASVSAEMGKIIIISLVIILVYVISYTIVDYINAQVQISNNVTEISNAVIKDPTLTDAQKSAYLNAIAPYIGGGGGGPGIGGIPSWAVGIGVAVGAGVVGYLAYNIISNQPRRPRLPWREKWATPTNPQATEP